MTNLTFDPDNTLAGGLSSLSPRETIELGIDICAAVESSYGINGCHGAIWPGNLSLIDGRVFIGPSEHLGVKEMNPDALEYIAPEQFWNGDTTPAADVYSIGLVMYTALNEGRMPFSEDGAHSPEARAAALQSRMRGKKPAYPRYASRELGDIVLQAISFHKEDRFANPSLLRQALLDLPEGAAVPAAVPVLPLTRDEVKSARSYKVDKEFEASEPQKPKKDRPSKPEPEPTPEQQQREIEEFRNPRRKPLWLIPVLLVAAAAIAAILLLKGCDSDPDPIPVITDELPASPSPTVEPTVEPSTEPTVEPTVQPTDEPAAEPSYEVVIEDVTWEQAASRCEEMGGHLATIKNDTELQNVIAAVEDAGASFVWLGAYRGNDSKWYYITGEELDYAVWDTNEPSAYDGDGTPENYMLMWVSRSRNMWCFNDTRNDPISVLPRTYSGKTAYVCQFD